ncbi:MAG: DUF945 family protein [Halomonadaceae bacterium]|nr:MAG: DUF945 family protein [Halomonadaceae bacterium]
MRALPRLLLLCSLLLLPVLLAAPWVTGRLAEQVYWQTLEGLREQPGVTVLGEGGYQRRYGQGEGITRVSLAAGDGRPAMTLQLTTDVEHRLTGVRSRTRVSGNSGLFPGGEPQLQLRAGLTGGLQGAFSVPAMHWPGAGGKGLQLQGFDGILAWRPGRQLNLTSTWEALSRGGQETPDWALTKGEFSLIGSASREQLNASLTLTADTLQVQGNPLGEQRFKGQIADFHGPSVVGIVSALEALYGQRQYLTLSAEAQEQRLAFNQLSDHLQALSVHGGELTLSLDSGGEGLGSLDGHLRLTYPALPDPYRQLPVSLLQHAQGETHVRLDRAYGEGMPAGMQPLLSHWQDKNWLKPHLQGLVFSARLKERVLLLEDGREIKLPPLL